MLHSKSHIPTLSCHRQGRIPKTSCVRVRSCSSGMASLTMDTTQTCSVVFVESLPYTDIKTLYIYILFLYTKWDISHQTITVDPSVYKCLMPGPTGELKRLKISDIKISHQPSRISPSRIFPGLFTFP